MPIAMIYDPITYRPWSYDIERQRLGAHGIELIVPADDAERARRLGDVDVLVVSDHLPSSELERLRRCTAIVCYGVGMNAVDADAARARGIDVVNVPGFCTEEVAAHAVALLLGLWRGVVAFAAAAREAEWDVVGTPAFRGLRRLGEMQVGVVGYGRIGRRTASMLRGLGIPVVASDPFVDADDDVRLVPLDELLATSDAVVLCAALAPTGGRLIDAGALDRMQAGAVLVNVARGGLVDEVALVEHLRSGHLAGAALDVRQTEPPTEPDELRRLPNVILTPHLAAVSKESDRDLHEQAAKRIIELLTRRET